MIIVVVVVQVPQRISRTNLMEYYKDCDDFEEDQGRGGCIHESSRNSECLIHDMYCHYEYEPEDPDLWLQPN